MIQDKTWISILLAVVCVPPWAGIVFAESNTSLPTSSFLLASDEPANESAVVYDNGSREGVVSSHASSFTTSDININERPFYPTTAESASAELYTGRAELQQFINSIEESTTVQIEIDLPDQPFRWSYLSRHDLTTEQRQKALAIRAQSVASATENVRTKLANLGATNIRTTNIATAVFATVPSTALAEIINWPEPADVRRLDTHLVPTGAYTGDDIRNGTRVVNLINANILGQSGSRSTTPDSRIKIGIIEGEEHFPNRWFSGFLDTAHHWRIVSTEDCYTQTCVATSAKENMYTHGNLVAQIAAGSVEGGQDPYVTNPTLRRRYSGMAPQADIYYWQGSTTNEDNGSNSNPSGWVAAIDKSTTEGVDVVNHSYAWYDCNPCVAGCLWGSGASKTAFNNSTNAGVLHVVAAGNPGDTGVCNIGHPADSPNVLVVGALDTASTATAYDSAPVASFSARGGKSVKMWSGNILPAWSVVTLLTPGLVGVAYDSYQGSGSSATYSYSSGTWYGTSFAAPVVTGAAGLLRQALGAYGIPNDARSLMANLIMLGDGYADSDGTKHNVGMDPRSGAGRLHMHFPSNSGADPQLVAPWGWGGRVLTISAGQELSFYVANSTATQPVDSRVTQWKLGMTWNEDDDLDVADITVHLYNACSGHPAVLMESDDSYDIKKRMMAFSEVRGTCLQVRVKAWGMPTGETRTVYISDYYHSGSISDH